MTSVFASRAILTGICDVVRWLCFYGGQVVVVWWIIRWCKVLVLEVKPSNVVGSCVRESRSFGLSRAG
jgi:hypothetical protein